MTADSAERQDVQRYGFDYRGDRVELRNGDWVRYTDHARRVEALERELAVERACHQVASDSNHENRKRAERAEAQVEAMRGLPAKWREAAKYGGCCCDDANRNCAEELDAALLAGASGGGG